MFQSQYIAFWTHASDMTYISDAEITVHYMSDSVYVWIERTELAETTRDLQSPDAAGRFHQPKNSGGATLTGTAHQPQADPATSETRL